MEKQQTVYRIEDAPMDALKQYVEQQAGAEARQRIEETLESAHRLKQEYAKLAEAYTGYWEAEKNFAEKTKCYFNYRFETKVGDGEKFRETTEGCVYNEVERAVCRVTTSNGSGHGIRSQTCRLMELIRWKTCTGNLEKNAWRLAATLCALEREIAATTVKEYMHMLRDFSWDDIQNGNLKLETENRSEMKTLYQKGRPEATGRVVLDMVKYIAERTIQGKPAWETSGVDFTGADFGKKLTVEGIMEIKPYQSSTHIKFLDGRIPEMLNRLYEEGKENAMETEEERAAILEAREKAERKEREREQRRKRFTV